MALQGDICPLAARTNSNLGADCTGAAGVLIGGSGQTICAPDHEDPGHDCVGTVSTDFARRTGLPAECRVLCGLHDSNASLFAHSTPNGAESLAVVSSGTWTIIMARGPDPKRVREPLDMLTNVDINGVAIPTARFMGGREYETIPGKAGIGAAPTLQKLESIIERGVVHFPRSAEPAGLLRIRAARSSAQPTYRERISRHWRAPTWR